MLKIYTPSPGRRHDPDQVWLRFAESPKGIQVFFVNAEGHSLLAGPLFTITDGGIKLGKFPASEMQYASRYLVPPKYCEMFDLETLAVLEPGQKTLKDDYKKLLQLQFCAPKAPAKKATAKRKRVTS